MDCWEEWDNNKQMDDDPKPKAKDAGQTYDNRLLDFFVSRSAAFKDNPQNKEWIMGQLKRVSTLSMYLYLWSENLRQSGGTVKQAREAISTLQLKIYGVKDMVDGKEFETTDLEQHRDIREQPDGQSIGDFYDTLRDEVRTRFPSLGVEHVAPIRNTIITDFRVLRGIKEDIDTGSIKSVTQLRDILFNLAATDLRAEDYLDNGGVVGTADKALGAQLGVALVGNMAVLGTKLKGRELKIRVAAVERGKPLMPKDGGQIERLKEDKKKFPS